MSPGERFIRASSPLVFLDHGPHSPPFCPPKQESCSVIKDEVGSPQKTLKGARRWVYKSETIAR